MIEKVKQLLHNHKQHKQEKKQLKLEKKQLKQQQKQYKQEKKQLKLEKKRKSLKHIITIIILFTLMYVIDLKVESEVINVASKVIGVAISIINLFILSEREKSIIAYIKKYINKVLMIVSCVLVINLLLFNIIYYIDYTSTYAYLAADREGVVYDVIYVAPCTTKFIAIDYIQFTDAVEYLHSIVFNKDRSIEIYDKYKGLDNRKTSIANVFKPLLNVMELQPMSGIDVASFISDEVKIIHELYVYIKSLKNVLIRTILGYLGLTYIIVQEVRSKVCQRKATQKQKNNMQTQSKTN